MSGAPWLPVHDGKDATPDGQEHNEGRVMETAFAAGHYDEDGYREVEQFLDSQQQLMDAQRAHEHRYRELEFAPAYQFYENMDARELHRVVNSSGHSSAQQAAFEFARATGGATPPMYIPREHPANLDVWVNDGRQHSSSIPPPPHAPSQPHVTHTARTAGSAPAAPVMAVPAPVPGGGNPAHAPAHPHAPGAVAQDASHIPADAPPRSEPDQSKKKRGRSATQSQAANKERALPKKPRASKSRTPAAAEGNKENVGSDEESGEIEVVAPEDELGDLGDSDVDLDVDSPSTAGTPGGKWINPDRALMYDYILGPDATEIWESLQLNRVYVFRKVVKELKFQGCYSAEAARKHFERALKTFRAINNALDVTGGAGDVDMHDHKGAITYFGNCIRSARARSVNIGKLTPKTMELWHNMKWTQLFQSRYGTDARMKRAVKFSSGAPIAPLPESTNNTPSSPSKPLSAAQTVTELKHRGKAKPDAPPGMTDLHAIVKQKVQNDEERGKARDAEAKERLEIERERLKLDKAREDNHMRLEFLKAASTSTVLSTEVKEKMNDWVGNLFS